MNISSMLSADSNANANKVASNKESADSVKVQLLGDVQPPSSPSSSPPESDLPNEHDAEKFTHQSPSAQEQSQSPFPSAISPLNDKSNHVLRANNSSHQPSTLSPLKHLNGSLPSPVSSDSIVSGILPTDYDIPDVSHTPIIDLKYKATFENNINVINKLDHYQLLNHSLKLLKFDEAKLNNYLINTGQFTSNYIDRVVAEDISSRNNKISDTNKNKELNYIDYSKPLHHNSTRGKEFKWGSTREIHKVDHKTRRRRQAASDDTSKATTSINGSNKENAQQVDGTAINNGSIKSDDKTHQDLPVSQSRLTRNHRSQNSLNQLQQQPILIKPKGAGTQGQFELHPRRSTRPKAKRKTFEEEEEAASTVAAATATTGASANSTATAKPDVVEVKVEESQETVTGGDTKRAKIDEDGKAKAVLSPAAAAGMTAKEYKAFMRQYDNTYISIWKDMSRKDGPKVSRLMQQATQAKLINLRKTCILAAREAKRWQLRNTKNQKDLTTKARRAMREMFNFWKRNERIERDLKKKHEKELLDKAKKEEEEREAKRQARKLNFLITQTELYSHFIGKKIKTDEIEGSDADGNFKPQQDRGHLDKYADVDGTASHDINSLDFDNDDEDALHRMAAENAQNALVNAQNKARQFDADEPFKNPDTNGEEMNFQNPTLMGDITVPQPNMLKCTLKEYQLKGLNWLANLYEQGINGILADEMGLGKTVQSISVLSYLAETHNIWGPFLVVTPASTLHNWQQEITKFVPEFKVLPYWGNSKDRKVLRKFWDRKSVRYDKDSPFHVLVTSYQLIVADIAYFQKMKWQYMILDEAQAIKSSSSSRWKSLLSLSCRNRLLLTGTPIQNSMQELWALLHFIMPTLFDSHDEFSDWFSKDIESHAQSNTNLDEQQLRRLHMILKPFMLRRIKKNVQSELGDKVEVDIFCDLTTRQKKLYQQLRSLISILDSDLLDSATSGSDSSLANLVMQFRKVCNHPDLFERADVKSPFSFGKFAETGSFLRESNELEMGYSTENIVEYQLPRLIYDELLCPNYKTNTLESVHEKFNIYSPENTKDLGWLNSINVSQGELNKLSRKDLLTRAIESQSYSNNSDLLGRMNYLYEGDYVPENKKLLITEYNDVPRSNSSALTELYSVVDGVYQDMYMNKLEPASTPLASAPPITLECSSLHFANRITNLLFDPSIRSALVPLSLSTEVELMKQEVPIDLYPKSNLWPMPTPTTDFSNIRMPSMERFIAECGKLAQLDKLLADLKKDGHRILIYFQMTRMMEIFEEYLCFKKFNFLRLDGSTTIESRRELVTQWQTNSDFFIFMLSTRAGGLGLNLTSADTVIFYDSDWNPTVDAQAMDRAHRIGQTKVVTVYRLLTRNTIEERIRQKAQNKEEIQKLVINQ